MTKAILLSVAVLLPSSVSNRSVVGVADTLHRKAIQNLRWAVANPQDAEWYFGRYLAYQDASRDVSALLATKHIEPTFPTTRQE